MLVKDLAKYDPSVEIIKGRDFELKRPADVKSVADQTLLFVKNHKFLDSALEAAQGMRVGLVIDKKLLDSIDDSLDDKFDAIITTSDVNISMSLLSKVFFDEIYTEKNMAVDGRQMGTCDIHPTVWIAQGAFVGDNVKLEENVKIHSGVVLMGDIKIGASTEIFPNVTIYQNVEIGSRCRIHAGVVIGGDGFGYNFKEGVHHKVWHLGGVRIGDDVEIGSNTTVDQGTFSPTIIENMVKLDNIVHIAHNSYIGKGVIFCGQAATAGSASVGDYTVLGGKAGVAPGCEVGAGSEIAGLGQVTSNFPAGSKVAGHPGRPLKEWLRGIAWVRKNSAK